MTEFRRIHMVMIDLIEDDDVLSNEQAALDEHDDLVATLTVRIMTLVESLSPTPAKGVNGRELLVRKCAHLLSRLSETSTALTSLTREDVVRLQQYGEQLLDHKRELSEINDALLSLTLEDSDELPSRVSSLEKSLFERSLRHKELSRTIPVSPSPSSRSD